MKNEPSKLPLLLKSERAVRGVKLGAGALAIGIIFWRLQFSTDAICCGDFDGYYHIRWSRMLWESLLNQAFPPVFTWLPLTTLNPTSYVDHHFLFHIFQTPFTWIGDLRMGAKIAAMLFASLAVFSCYWLLLRYEIRYTWVWLVALLACSAPFLFRLNMAKAPPFAIIYLIAGVHLLFQKKYWPLLPLAFVFTLTYDVFLLLVFAAFVWMAIIGWTERRFEWRPAAFILAGVAAGLVINPYFPQNLQLFYEHLRMKLTAADFSTRVGGEWYPYNSWEFLGNSLVACVAMVVGYVAFDPEDRKRSPHALFFLVLATALMIATARWKRSVEYWPPFAIIFAAFALQPWLDGARSALTRLPAEVLDDLQPFLDRDDRNDGKEFIRMAIAAVIAVLLGVVLFFNLKVTIEDIGKSERHDYYRAGAEWMSTQIPPGQIIFNTDWDDFPRLFYYNPNHNYVSGLDPTYLYDRDPALSKLYDRITLGNEKDPGPLIRDRFGARYVFTDNHHDRFFENATESGWFEIVYEDTECTILRIREERDELSEIDDES
ncbi:MAG TPA: hypothetical protein VMM84_15420 [Pyrinomonadaceae bacterium]|nr:hypothetical protein [Pyrinomonadaceae bacterium]